MIKQIKIDGLFGYYTYIIELKNKVTIIHGPNGCGKTTLLNMIDSLFNKRLYLLSKIELGAC